MGEGAMLQWQRGFAICRRPFQWRETGQTGVTTIPAASDQLITDLAATLAQTLALSPESAAGLQRSTLLFGNLPELDSMAVATVLTALEDRFGILIDDDEISAELFESVGSLGDFIAGKIDAHNRTSAA